MDPTTAAITIGAPSVASMVIAFVVWSLKRNVKTEDDAKVKVETKQEKFDRELQELRTDHAASAHKAEMSAHDARTQLATLAGTLGELKGALTGVRQSFEEGREKQAEFYRAELAKVEQTFRQELSRHMHPDLPERVGKLEARFEAKRKRP